MNNLKTIQSHIGSTCEAVISSKPKKMKDGKLQRAMGIRKLFKRIDDPRCLSYLERKEDEREILEPLHFFLSLFLIQHNLKYHV